MEDNERNINPIMKSNINNYYYPSHYPQHYGYPRYYNNHNYYNYKSQL